MKFADRINGVTLRNTALVALLYVGVAAVVPRLALDLAPALLLAIALLFGYTPNERVVRHFAERRRKRLSRRRGVRRIAPVISHESVSGFVARIVAHALAMRPPPAAAVLH